LVRLFGSAFDCFASVKILSENSIRSIDALPIAATKESSGPVATYQGGYMYGDF